MWSIDDFLECCDISNNDECICDRTYYHHQLEMMCLGTISSSEWDKYTYGVLQNYWDSFVALWEDAGVSHEWWYASWESRLSRDVIVRAIEIMSEYAEAIESGVPVEDIIA